MGETRGLARGGLWRLACCPFPSSPRRLGGPCTDRGGLVLAGALGDVVDHDGLHRQQEEQHCARARQGAARAAGKACVELHGAAGVQAPRAAAAAAGAAPDHRLPRLPHHTWPGRAAAWARCSCWWAGCRSAQTAPGEGKTEAAGCQAPPDATARWLPPLQHPSPACGSDACCATRSQLRLYVSPARR